MYLTTSFEFRMFRVLVALASVYPTELGLRFGSFVPLRLECLVQIAAVGLWVLGTDLAPGFRSTWGAFSVSMERIPASDPGHPRRFPLSLPLLEMERKAYHFQCRRTRRRWSRALVPDVRLLPIIGLGISMNPPAS